MKKIPLYKKLNPIWWIGNDKDTKPPKWFKPKDSGIKRKFFWFVRNPFHNFCFHIIGCVDSNPKLKHQWFMGYWTINIIKTKYMLYPFVNYWNLDNFITKFYIGWRPDGAFGFKLNFKHKE